MIKVINKACQILAAVAGLAALVFFFFTFVKFNMADGNTVDASGFQIAFGSELYAGLKVAKSAKILFNIVLTILSVATAIFTFFSKSQKLKYFNAGISAVVAVFMLVVALSNPYKFVDVRPFDVTNLVYGGVVLFIAIAMFVATFAEVAHFLLSDYIEVLASKGAKKPLLKRIWQFFKDYKSETKKIVWPGLKEVVKNTGIVLIMFLVIGAIVWLVDLGLGSLLRAIW
ncbi:MAG: preprotein translocase subunit SecE [Acutalibacteraceae bacterium]|nr:preprotein translocase subunit SecE [Acutalibacteraceae bacterium]